MSFIRFSGCIFFIYLSVTLSSCYWAFNLLTSFSYQYMNLESPMEHFFPFSFFFLEMGLSTMLSFLFVLFFIFTTCFVFFLPFFFLSLCSFLSSSSFFWDKDYYSNCVACTSFILKTFLPPQLPSARITDMCYHSQILSKTNKQKTGFLHDMMLKV